MIRSSFRRLMAANTTVSISDLKDPKWWVLEAFGGTATKSGANVTPESAFTIAAYYLGVAAISEDIAKLPFSVNRRLDRGSEKVPEHPVQEVLDYPNPETDGFTFRETLQHHALGWGDGLAEIERDHLGRPSAMWLVHPSRVTIQRETLRDGERPIIYTIRMDDKRPNAVVRRRQQDMFHVKPLGNMGVRGYSPVALRRESLGLTMQAEAAGATLFGNGMIASGILEHPETLSEDAVKTLRTQFADVYGGADNFWKPLILEKGMQWKNLGINPTDAQFIETRTFQIEEVARWLRMPPQKLMHLLRTSGAQTAELDTAYYKETLLPWMVRWERQANWKLLGEAERASFFTKHNEKAILRADPKTQANWYKTMFMVGGFSPNDIRELEDRNPYEGGDERFVPTNMARAQDVAEGKFAKTNKNPTGQVGNADGNGRPPKGEENADLLPLFVDAADRCLRREVNAAERAFKRCDGDPEKFQKWLATFYVDQERYWIGAYEALAFVVGIKPATLEGWAMEQVAASISELKAEWASTRNPAALMDRVDSAATDLMQRAR